ncbi:SAM-dependent methyltransferase [Nocardiopsis gilva YIM 90087]|uniref:SAM-dependent methyltransferase n=1 Tax=Nocardiopsis gilva YIM 90087 TaxID=1235441 RepID=A0A223S1P8_9ACTN|nr:class I SAM-dependent methyltransferase [Nocardiopsis gilva]ASU82036.1 SAM-dependent methyltransferase [Nocardiopsis gilva YIM 90087]
MSAPGSPRFEADWLALREGADADARDAGLLVPLRAHLAAEHGRRRGGSLNIHDLGSGTGSMARWLAPLLDGPQHWVLHDRDPELLERAAGFPPEPAADGAPVTVRTRLADLTELDAVDLKGADLVTASALLDLLTADELNGLAEACTGVGCPVLLTLSVAGHVVLTPDHPLDADIAAAFNAHQRREVQGRRLLGPDAPDAAARAFRRRGAPVYRRSSPWRLGPEQRRLMRQWLEGWVAAAVEQRTELSTEARTYVEWRLGECASGRLRAEVHHVDLLVLPDGPAAEGRHEERS